MALGWGALLGYGTGGRDTGLWVWGHCASKLRGQKVINSIPPDSLEELLEKEDSLPWKEDFRIWQWQLMHDKFQHPGSLFFTLWLRPEAVFQNGEKQRRL